MRQVGSSGQLAAAVRADDQQVVLATQDSGWTWNMRTTRGVGVGGCVPMGLLGGRGLDAQAGKDPRERGAEMGPDRLCAWLM
jgi:hypothetical protein